MKAAKTQKKKKKKKKIERNVLSTKKEAFKKIGK